MVYFYLCLLLLILPATSLGQHYNLKNYSIADGLAQSQVRSIYQDRKGYLWIGTSGGGVSKFDGLVFANFTTKNGLADNHVRTIVEDVDGNIWFGTKEGVSRYDRVKFHRLTAGDSSEVNSILEDNAGDLWFGTDKGAWKYEKKTSARLTKVDNLGNNVIMSILEDQAGKLWFGTEGEGVRRYDGKTVTNFSTVDGLPNNTVYSILEDQKGNLWFGTHEGAGKYDGKTFLDYTVEDGLSNNIIRSIIEDREGNLWFGTDGGGICKFDGKVFTNITEKNGLSSNVIWSLLEDREGNIWIGTYRGGLNKYRGEAFTYFSSEDGLCDDVIRAILQDRAGNFWFGTFRGGVNKFDGESMTTFTTRDGLIDNFVLTIFEDLKGNLWFGTYGGVSKYDGKKFLNISRKDGLPDRIVRSIVEDRAGNIWFGTNRGGISKYAGKTITNFSMEDGINDDQISALMLDRDGIIWIATLNGICFYDGKIFTNISKKCGFKQKNIYSILEDKNGGLWFGAYGGGILKYTPAKLSGNYQKKHDGVNFLCEVFNSKDGLNNDNVVSMIFDDSGNLWIGTEKGVCQLDVGAYEKTGEKIFKYYGREEGFDGFECIHNSICKDSDGNIWFGTINGAIKYNPGRDKPNLIEPKTYIIGLRPLFAETNLFDYADGISSKDGLPTGLRLPYDKNHLLFDFIALSFTVPERVKYRFKLEGFDDYWKPVNEKEKSIAVYSKLPPGEYAFKVKAGNNNGIWNKEPTSFYFKITPPFWQTWWFRGLVFLVFLSVVLVVYQMRTTAVRRRAHQLEKLVEERTLEQKKLQEKLVRREKLAVLGQLAGGVSHELRNPLGVIKNAVYFLNMALEKPGPEVKESLEILEKEVATSERIINSLLDYARSRPPQCREVDINEILRDVLSRINAPGNIQVVNQAAESLPIIMADPDQLGQVLGNIILNAIQAMPGGGRLMITPGIQNTGWAAVTIADTGVGIPGENLEKIFEPLFTTKAKGIGLGMAISKTFVEGHGGSIEVQSEAGKGTVFTVRLPIRESKKEGK